MIAEAATSMRVRPNAEEPQSSPPAPANNTATAVTFLSFCMGTRVADFSTRSFSVAADFLFSAPRPAAPDQNSHQNRRIHTDAEEQPHSSSPSPAPASLSTRAVTVLSSWGSDVADFSTRSFTTAAEVAADLFSNSRSTPEPGPPAAVPQNSRRISAPEPGPPVPPQDSPRESKKPQRSKTSLPAAVRLSVPSPDYPPGESIGDSQESSVDVGKGAKSCQSVSKGREQSVQVEGEKKAEEADNSEKAKEPLQASSGSVCVPIEKRRGTTPIQGGVDEPSGQAEFAPSSVLTF